MPRSRLRGTSRSTTADIVDEQNDVRVTGLHLETMRSCKATDRLSVERTTELYVPRGDQTTASHAAYGCWENGASGFRRWAHSSVRHLVPRYMENQRAHLGRIVPPQLESECKILF